MLVIEAGIDIDMSVMKLVGTRGLMIAVVGSFLPIGVGVLIAWAIKVGDFKAIIASGAVFGPTSLGIALNVLKGGTIDFKTRIPFQQLQHVISISFAHVPFQLFLFPRILKVVFLIRKRVVFSIRCLFFWESKKQHSHVSLVKIDFLCFPWRLKTRRSNDCCSRCR